jgi:hypothetical protein
VVVMLGHSRETVLKLINQLIDWDYVVTVHKHYFKTVQAFWELTDHCRDEMDEILEAHNQSLVARAQEQGRIAQQRAREELAHQVALKLAAKRDREARDAQLELENSRKRDALERLREASIQRSAELLAASDLWIRWMHVRDRTPQLVYPADVVPARSAKPREREWWLRLFEDDQPSHRVDRPLAQEDLYPGERQQEEWW